MQQLLGGPGLNLTRANSKWIGTPVHENVVCTVTRASGITSMAAWLDAKTPAAALLQAPQPMTSPRSRRRHSACRCNSSPGKGTAEIRLAADGGDCWGLLGLGR